MTPPPLLRLDGRRRASLARWLPEGSPLAYRVAVDPVSGVVTLTPDPPVTPQRDPARALAQAFDAIMRIRAMLARAVMLSEGAPEALRGPQGPSVDPETPGEPRSGASDESGGPGVVDWRDWVRRHRESPVRGASDESGGPGVVDWRDIDPEDAEGIDLTARLDIAAPHNEAGERCPWPWETQQIVGVLLGPYHCPYCGAVATPGAPHPDYKIKNEAGRHG